MSIGYEFKDKSLFDLAFTHISLANDQRIESNQRLEFLGDSILSYIIADKIYELHPEMDEGDLTKLRASLVCEKSLAHLGRKLELSEYIKLGKAEKNSGGAEKSSILADTFEAVLGAIYLDSDIETAREWTLSVFGDGIRGGVVFEDVNYKSELQIFFQKRDKNNDVVKYFVTDKSGPDHDPEFSVEASYQGRIIGKGKGTNRKVAEQMAAKAALEALDR